MTTNYMPLVHFARHLSRIACSDERVLRDHIATMEAAYLRCRNVAVSNHLRVAIDQLEMLISEPQQLAA